jgi:hypothetical protein
LKKILGFFRKTPKRIQNKSKFEYAILYNLAKHVHAKFQLSSLYPDGLRHIFEENFRIFQENSLANSKEFQT